MKLFIVICIFLFALCQARIREVKIEDDVRPNITLTSFRFLSKGHLNISLHNFIVHPANGNDNSSFFRSIGFTFEKVSNDGVDGLPPSEREREKCVQESSQDQRDSPTTNGDIVFFRFNNWENRTLAVTCSADTDVENLLFFDDVEPLLDEDGNKDIRQNLAECIRSIRLKIFNGKKKIGNLLMPYNGDQIIGHNCRQKLRFRLKAENGSYRIRFTIVFTNSDAEGLYNLVYHSCANYDREDSLKTSFVMNIVERNVGSYLSAGDIPLPTVYAMMSIMFFLSAIFWTFTLRQSRHPVYKIHDLMDLLVILKTLALLFHGINYYYISERGEHVTPWAILYYVTKVFKGVVLTSTLVLIGTGWIFVKQNLSFFDKAILLIAIPLQILGDVAEIIIEQLKEAGRIEKFSLWMSLLDDDIDFLTYMYIVILLPVIRSIKYLKNASETNGKVSTVYLEKLELYRHFLTTVISYFCVTRIILYLSKVTEDVHTWVYEGLQETATFVFFGLIGYKFRPGVLPIKECVDTLEWGEEPGGHDGQQISEPLQKGFGTFQKQVVSARSYE